MELDLVLSILSGVFLLAVFLYFFRNVLALVLGPAVGVFLYRCHSPNAGLDNSLLSAYMANIRRIAHYVLHKTANWAIEILILGHKVKPTHVKSS